MTTVPHPSDFPKQLSPLRHARMESMAGYLYDQNVRNGSPGDAPLRWCSLCDDIMATCREAYGLLPQRAADKAIDDMVNNGLATFKDGHFMMLTPEGLKIGKKMYLPRGVDSPVNGTDEC